MFPRSSHIGREKFATAPVNAQECLTRKTAELVRPEPLSSLRSRPKDVIDRHPPHPLVPWGSRQEASVAHSSSNGRTPTMSMSDFNERAKRLVAGKEAVPKGSEKGSPSWSVRRRSRAPLPAATETKRS